MADNKKIEQIMRERGLINNDTSPQMKALAARVFAESDMTSGAHKMARTYVGTFNEPSEREEAVSKFYKDYIRAEEVVPNNSAFAGNFFVFDENANKWLLFDPRGVESGDLFDAGSSIAEGVGGTVATALGAGTGALVGAPSGPGSLFTATMAGNIAGGVGAQASKGLFNEAMDMYMGEDAVDRTTSHTADAAIDTTAGLALDTASRLGGQLFKWGVGAPLKWMIGKEGFENIFKSRNTPGYIEGLKDSDERYALSRLDEYDMAETSLPSAGTASGSKGVTRLEQRLNRAPFSGDFLEESMDKFKHDLNKSIEDWNFLAHGDLDENLTGTSRKILRDANSKMQGGGSVEEALRMFSTDSPEFAAREQARSPGVNFGGAEGVDINMGPDFFDADNTDIYGNFIAEELAKADPVMFEGVVPRPKEMKAALLIKAMDNPKILDVKNESFIMEDKFYNLETDPAKTYAELLVPLASENPDIDSAFDKVFDYYIRKPGALATDEMDDLDFGEYQEIEKVIHRMRNDPSPEAVGMVLRDGIDLRTQQMATLRDLMTQMNMYDTTDPQYKALDKIATDAMNFKNSINEKTDVQLFDMLMQEFYKGKNTFKQLMDKTFPAHRGLIRYKIIENMAQTPGGKIDVHKFFAEYNDMPVISREALFEDDLARDQFESIIDTVDRVKSMENVTSQRGRLNALVSEFFLTPLIAGGITGGAGFAGGGLDAAIGLGVTGAVAGPMVARNTLKFLTNDDTIKWLGKTADMPYKDWTPASFKSVMGRLALIADRNPDMRVPIAEYVNGLKDIGGAEASEALSADEFKAFMQSLSTDQLDTFTDPQGTRQKSIWDQYIAP